MGHCVVVGKIRNLERSCFNGFFLKVFILGDNTILSGREFQGRITLREKKNLSKFVLENGIYNLNEFPLDILFFENWKKSSKSIEMFLFNIL